MADRGLRWHAQSLTSLQRLIVIFQIQFSNSRRAWGLPHSRQRKARVIALAL
ncbi:MAG: hypothetical protein OJF48_004042 [Afipia sp.]|nr:MAG: hypothetical protein OJF48_004042 [Afipia sp.]